MIRNDRNEAQTTLNVSALKRLADFGIAGPTVIDILELIGISKSVRNSIHEWDVQGEADYDCCDRLSHSRVLRPICGTFDANCPPWALQDLLEEDGWEGRMAHCVHQRKSPKVFCSQRLQQKRAYLRCVVASRQLFNAGVTKFESGRTEAYYIALRTLQRDISVDLLAVEYREIVRKSIGEPVIALAIGNNTQVLVL